MDQPPGVPGSTPPTEGHPAGAEWTSPLWGDPYTVGGLPAATPTQTLPPPPAPVPTTGPAAGRRRLVVSTLVTVLVAALLGAVVVRAWPSEDRTPTAAQAPAPSATPDPSTTPSSPPPTPSPSDGSNGSDQLPSIGDLIPGIGNIPGIDQLPGFGGQSPTQSAPAYTASVAKALVNITTTVGYDGGEAAGTGVVLTSDGYVLTNHHVVAGSTSIHAAVAGTSHSYTATVVGYDASHDIAVIKLSGASGLTTAPLGDSDSVREGDKVTGMGNAGGKGGNPVPASGSVTGLDRSITALDSENGVSERLTGLIETDADIAPGDSGGALVADTGKVVGIITAGSVSQDSSTDGYAVPINQAVSIADDIRAGRASATIHIGASAFLGISVSTTTSSGGVRVRDVVAGSAAEKAGISAGSTITEIDGKTVTDNASLRAAIAAHHPGDTVTVRWTDSSGRTRSASVTFGSGPVA